MLKRRAYWGYYVDRRIKLFVAALKANNHNLIKDMLFDSVNITHAVYTFDTFNNPHVTAAIREASPAFIHLKITNNNLSDISDKIRNQDNINYVFLDYKWEYYYDKSIYTILGENIYSAFPDPNHREEFKEYLTNFSELPKGKPYRHPFQFSASKIP